MTAMVTPRRAVANDISQAAAPTAGEATALLLAHPLFRGLRAGAATGLAHGLEPLLSRDRSWLFREGAPARHCLLVLRGRVEVLRTSHDGEERVYGLFSRGQLVAEASLFMPHGRYPMSARAQGEVLAARLGRAALREACERQPALALRMLDWLGERIYRRTNEVDWLTGSSAAQRVAAYLLTLQEPGQAAGSLHIPLSRQQLAGRLGIRPETLSRLLSDWRRQGRLGGGPRVLTMRDPAFFRELASNAQRPF